MNKRIVVAAAPFTSPLGQQIERFLQCKRALGCRYREEERALRVLDRFLAVQLSAVDPVITLEIVRTYVARQGNESETTRGHRLSLLRQLCHFLALEDARTVIPPPRFLRINRQTFLPRVLTREEGQRFVRACATLPGARCSPLRGIVHGTALILLYLTGLRVGEAIALTLQDVDLDAHVLRIRHAKFGKSRLVPLADDLADRLDQCRSFVAQHLGERPQTEPFFVGPHGLPCSKDALRSSFRKVLAEAGIPWLGQGKGPRLHDLRHTFAVHRMLFWYEQEVDLGAQLPLLATYLGHVGLASSQRYLRLTEDLVGEVTRRFDTHFGYLIVERGMS